MRTTLQIDDDLLQRAKQRARHVGVTLGQLVEAGLRRELTVPPSDEPPPKVPIYDGGTPPPAGVDLRSGREIAELFTDEDAHRARMVQQ